MHVACFAAAGTYTLTYAHRGEPGESALRQLMTFCPRSKAYGLIQTSEQSGAPSCLLSFQTPPQQLLRCPNTMWCNGNNSK